MSRRLDKKYSGSANVNDKTEYYNKLLLDLLVVKRNRAELKQLLNLADANIRERISICAYDYPIISYSTSKGYRVPKRVEDLTDEQLNFEVEEVQHTLNEINSRIKCLKMRMKPLIAYLKVAEKRKNKENE